MKNHSPKIQAYINQKTSGKMASDKARIILSLLSGPKTIENFVLSGFKIQTISARLSDLEDEGIIVRKADSGNGYSWFYLEDDPIKQDQNILAKQLEKKLDWLKRGLKLGAIDQQEYNLLAIKFV